jgi:hypothetical protein
MANELNIALTTGLTVTAQRYQAGASVGSPISCPEVGTTGFYSGDMAGTAGTYQLVFQSGAATIGTGQIVWSGTAEIPVSTLTTADIPTSDITAIKSKTDNLPSDPADQSLVEAAISALTIPTAAAIADEVRVELTAELANLDAPVSGATAPTASTVATAVRSELATELAHLDADISTRAVPADIPSSDISAIKTKTDALNTDRLGQCSTVATTGAQLAAALS